MVVVVFFKQKTAYEMRISDWSSDVCSSDLEQAEQRIDERGDQRRAEADLIGRDGARRETGSDEIGPPHAGGAQEDAAQRDKYDQRQPGDRQPHRQAENGDDRCRPDASVGGGGIGPMQWSAGGARGHPRYRFVFAKMRSNITLSAKKSFCAACQPKKSSAMVTRFSWGNCVAYFAAAAGLLGR